MNETSNRIKEIREQISNLQLEMHKLEVQNYHYYVARVDYCDECASIEYIRFGFTSEEKVKEWLESEIDEGIYSYFEISEEESHKWALLEDLKTLSNHLKYSQIRGHLRLDSFDRFYDDLRSKTKDLQEELGISRYLEAYIVGIPHRE